MRELPDPIALPGHVVVRTVSSAVSAGTERYVVDLARKSLLGKARERPDHVRRVVQKIKQEGLLPTLTQVFAKLDEPMPLGYSSAGVVVECGRGVQEFKPGDRVALAGPHAGVVSIGRNLCAHIPEGVTFEQATYTSIAAIGLEGVRLARVTLGERVLVIGLGLIGQICICLLKAQGCRVFGTDIDPKKLELATALGADAVGTGSPAEAVRAFSDSYGVDAVVITAATASNGPIEFAAEACRPKGRIVLVGVAGLNLPRDPFFKKELEFTVSSSLGPGRGDPSYEEKGIDYPIGHARWTARRNMQAVLETVAAGRLPVEKLTTHRFPIERAAEAYELITSRREPFLGIVIDYPEVTALPRRRVSLAARPAPDGVLGVSMIGAGNFARLIMFPILSKLGGVDWRGLCTAKGMNAEHSGRNMGFDFATTDVAELWKDEATRAVFIATRHDLHAELVVAALRAGKHVFVEKPLCIRPEELTAVARCVEELGDECPVLMVGFNRRFAPALAQMRSAAAASSARRATPSTRASRSPTARPSGSSPSRWTRSTGLRRPTTASSSRCATPTAASRTSPIRRAATVPRRSSASWWTAAAAPASSTHGTRWRCGAGTKSRARAARRTRGTRPSSNASSRSAVRAARGPFRGSTSTARPGRRSPPSAACARACRSIWTRTSKGRGLTLCAASQASFITRSRSGR